VYTKDKSLWGEKKSGNSVGIRSAMDSEKGGSLPGRVRVKADGNKEQTSLM